MTIQDIALGTVTDLFNLDGTTSRATTIKGSALASTTPAVGQALIATAVSGGVVTTGWGSTAGTLTQVLTGGNTANNLNLVLTGTGTLTAPMLAFANAGSNSITLRLPISVATSYSVTLPSSTPTYGQSLITTDAAGNTNWFLAGLEMIRLVGTGNITLTGTQTVDGVATALNDRVLAQNQTNTNENGLYAANNAGAWVKLTTYPSQSLFVTAGTVNANTTYTRNETGSPEQWILTNGGGIGAGGLKLVAAIATTGVFPLRGIVFVDNYTPSQGDLVLLTDQTSPAEQGLYTVNTPGNWSKLTTSVGDSFFALNGLTNAGSTFTRTAATPYETYIRTAVNSATGSVGTLQQVTTAGNITNLPILLGTSTDNLTLTQTQISRSAAGSLAIRAGTTITDAVTIGSSATTAVNSVAIRGAATGNAPTIAVSGDTNLSLNIAAAGSGAVNIGTNLANYVRITGAATGTAPTIAPVGDANLSLNLAASGTGTINLGTNQTSYVQVVLSPILAPVLRAFTTSQTNFPLALQGQGNGTVDIATNLANYIRITGATAGNAATIYTGGDLNGSINISGALGGTGSVNIGTNQTNFVRITPAATGTAPTIAPVGDANLSLNVSGSGTGNVNIGTNQTNFFRIAPAATGTAPTISAVGDANTSFNITGSGTGSVNIGTNRVNYVSITPAATGTAPTISAVGDTSLSLNIAAAGSGNINIGTHQTNSFRIAAAATGTAPTISAVGDANTSFNITGSGTGSVNIGTNLANYVSVTPAAANITPVIQAAGLNDNINLRILPKGTGSVVLGGDGQGVSIGSPITTAFTSPLYAAPGLNPSSSGLSAGTQGQVLTSRGPGNTPGWVTSTALGEGMWTLNSIASGSGSTTFGTLNTVQVYNTLGQNYTATGIALPSGSVYEVWVSLAFNWSGANGNTIFIGGVGTGISGTFVNGTTVLASGQISISGFSNVDAQTASGYGRLNGGSTYVFWIYRSAPPSGSTAFGGGSIKIRRVS